MGLSNPTTGSSDQIFNLSITTDEVLRVITDELPGTNAVISLTVEGFTMPPQQEVLKCTSNRMVSVNISQNTAPAINQAGVDRIADLLNEIEVTDNADETVDEVCVSLQAEESPLFLDADSDADGNDIDNLELSYILSTDLPTRFKISNTDIDPDKPQPPPRLTGDLLCVTGYNTGATNTDPALIDIKATDPSGLNGGESQTVRIEVNVVPATG